MSKKTKSQLERHYERLVEANQDWIERYRCEVFGEVYRPRSKKISREELLHRPFNRYFKKWAHWDAELEDERRYAEAHSGGGVVICGEKVC